MPLLIERYDILSFYGQTLRWDVNHDIFTDYGGAINTGLVQHTAALPPMLCPIPTIYQHSQFLRALAREEVYDPLPYSAPATTAQGAIIPEKLERPLLRPKLPEPMKFEYKNRHKYDFRQFMMRIETYAE